MPPQHVNLLNFENSGKGLEIDLKETEVYNRNRIRVMWYTEFRYELHNGYCLRFSANGVIYRLPNSYTLRRAFKAARLANNGSQVVTLTLWRRFGPKPKFECKSEP